LPGKEGELSDISKFSNHFEAYKFFILGFILLSGVIIAGCSSPSKNEAPVISDLIAPDSMQKGSIDTFYIFIKASDPEGLDDITNVFYMVTRPDDTLRGPYDLYDNGLNGDSVAGDGVFSGGFRPPTLQNLSGNFIFSFKARDKKGAYSNTIDKIITAYEYPYPVISHITVNQYDLQHQHIYASARVLDIPVQSNIDTVWVEITYQDSNRFIGSFLLNDDGAYGDSTAADAYYSADILAPNDIYSPGSYLIVFKAVDINGHLATSVDRQLIVE
jgi:hypothetical protein